MKIYRGSFTVVVEATTAKERDAKLDAVDDYLAKEVFNLGIEGYGETEETWEGTEDSDERL